MKRYIIVPLMKSPHRKGRIGPERFQDWYRCVEKALYLSSAMFPSRILIVSAFRASGGESEVEIYRRVFSELGASDIGVIEKGYETTEQIDEIFKEAQATNSRPVIVSTFLHYPRVRWICRGKKAVHRVAFGIPRPAEAITDIVSMILFPILDKTGIVPFFKRAVRKRRKKGKLF